MSETLTSNIISLFFTWNNTFDGTLHTMIKLICDYVHNTPASHQLRGSVTSDNAG